MISAESWAALAEELTTTNTPSETVHKAVDLWSMTINTSLQTAPNLTEEQQLTMKRQILSLIMDLGNSVIGAFISGDNRSLNSMGMMNQLIREAALFRSGVALRDIARQQAANNAGGQAPMPERPEAVPAPDIHVPSGIVIPGQEVPNA